MCQCTFFNPLFHLHTAEASKNALQCPNIHRHPTVLDSGRSESTFFSHYLHASLVHFDSLGNIVIMPNMQPNLPHHHLHCKPTSLVHSKLPTSYDHQAAWHSVSTLMSVHRHLNTGHNIYLTPSPPPSLALTSPANSVISCISAQQTVLPCLLASHGSSPTPTHQLLLMLIPHLKPLSQQHTLG